MLLMERIPDQIGYLVLTGDGAVLASGGELENNERVANVIMSLVTLESKIDDKTSNNKSFNKILIKYPNHCYIVCLSNKKIHVIKKKTHSAESHTNSNDQNLMDFPPI
ncbi:ragulator complex protein LAMTOR4 homolog [Chelonus insularis]|uniref:ragulator complex protein LAMTOR4 homolog n=1 Tax=Chelonus insularis TaxID=460826 RepID=UPI00158D5D64|nr:ragulator complex protein LAMTOR4 homolog [Chelonus insularis]XP_034944950.1 ragulator complex protein LAMTOR4 homolog [Chelonus insularis]